MQYGASAYQGNASDRYYSGAGNGSTAIDVGGGYMIVGDDENNVLRLYHERHSGPPVKTFNFTGVLPYGAGEIDIEASARAGNTLYWMGSMANTHHGEPQPAHDVLFAATISGSGASTELTYLGSYTHLREDLIEWDNTNGKPLGLSASAEEGAPSDVPTGFNIEGSSSPPARRRSVRHVPRPARADEQTRKGARDPGHELLDLVKHGNPGLTKADVRHRRWNGTSAASRIREIRKNAEGEYLIIAGQSEESNTSYALYGLGRGTRRRTGAAEHTRPRPGRRRRVGGHRRRCPNPITNGDEVELLEDNGDTAWYETGPKTPRTASPKGCRRISDGCSRSRSRLRDRSGPPHLQSGSNPNSGKFTIRWKPAPTLRAQVHAPAPERRRRLDHGRQQPQQPRIHASNPETEGTWNYRVKESNETAEAEFSTESEAIKVDRTPPVTPTASRLAWLRLRRQRRLVQGQRDGVLHLQR